MTTFIYTITHPLGLHARPAALLTDLCKSLSSQITITKGDQMISATRLVPLLLLEVKQDDTISVALEGPQETEEAQTLLAYFQENL